nr:PREDICTED: olfactory receptor-like protein OLF3 [Latimeria chalumnae]|eukprot:XP_006008079.2 PREDICTED: olfactory receptor-like protein OLF3 [Latimeria chalumnae]
MEIPNITRIQDFDFYITGFSEFDNTESFFVFLALVYVITLLGNFALMAVIYLEQQLHTARYMAVFNLAVIDIIYNIMLIPKMIHDFLFKDTYVGFKACFTQIFFTIYMNGMESLTLSVMSYDRLLAVCYPLRYPSINTNTRMFIILVTSWIVLLCPVLYLVILTSKLDYCASKDIQSFYCELGPTLHLPCGDVSKEREIALIAVGFMLFGPLAFICITYIALITVVKKIANAEGQRKAFNTCASHLFLVLVFFVPVITTYMFCACDVPFTSRIRKIIIVLSNTLPPMLNPIIYSLKTEEITRARRATGRGPKPAGLTPLEEVVAKHISSLEVEGIPAGQDTIDRK